MTPLSFSHVSLNCRDPITSEQFYIRHFGFHRARIIPLADRDIVFLKLGDTYLELFQSEAESPIPQPIQDGPTYPGWRHIAFRVDNVDAKLAAMGADARIMLGPLSFDEFIPGWRSVWIADPEGNIIEISQGYRDQDQPPALDDQRQPVPQPIGLA